MLRFPLIVTTLAALAMAPAVAGPGIGHGRDMVTAVVNYRGLDLTTPEGRQMLDRKIARAAKRICSRSDSFSLTGRREQNRCQREAMANARPQRDLAVANAMRRERLADASLAIKTYR